MNLSARTLHFLCALLSALIWAASCAHAQSANGNPRIALVIGNDAYPDQALATTSNDAGLIAQTLEAAGFDVVGARDLDGQSLRIAFRDFLDKAAAAGPDMQAFVYLSGRALQYDGDNYFVPVDARIAHAADAPLEAVRLSDFTHALAETPGRARIIVVDGARANPYPAEGAPLAPGLALVDPEPGELIAFNAAPGTLAGDEQGPYGVYGKTLAGTMRQGGVDVAQVFEQTRVLVNQETEGALIPWSASKLDGPYYIFERAADAPPPVVAAAPAANQPIASLSPEDAYAAAVARDTMSAYEAFLAAYPHSDQARRVRAILAARREAAFWRRSVNANTPRAYWTYLRVYPKGPHVADARRRLAILSAQFEPPPDFRPFVYEDLPPPPPDEGFYEEQPVYAFDDLGPPPPAPPGYYVYEDEEDWRNLPPPPPPQEVGALPFPAIGIPLAVGAVAYHHRHRDHDGRAPRGFRPPAPPPLAPPPLPANIRPIAPPPPNPNPAAPPRPGVAVVKPLPPIGPTPAGGGKPPAAAPAPAAAGKPLPAPTPVPAAPSAPATKSPAAPLAPSAPPPGGKPGAPPVPAAPTPPPAAASKPPPAPPPISPTPAPAAKPPTAPIVPAAPPAGGKPSAAPAAPTPPPVMGKPAPPPLAPAAPVGKPPAVPKAPPSETKPQGAAPAIPKPQLAPLAPAPLPAAPVVHVRRLRPSFTRPRHLRLRRRCTRRRLPP